MVHGSGVAGYETVMMALRMINGCFRELDGECVLLFFGFFPLSLSLL